MGSICAARVFVDPNQLMLPLEPTQNDSFGGTRLSDGVYYRWFDLTPRKRQTPNGGIADKIDSTPPQFEGTEKLNLE